MSSPSRRRQRKEKARQLRRMEALLKQSGVRLEPWQRSRLEAAIAQEKLEDAVQVDTRSRVAEIERFRHLQQVMDALMVNGHAFVSTPRRGGRQALQNLVAAELRSRTNRSEGENQ
ncbi:hypothetical protein Back2_17660 [Nocardioides baekrokdamisoli]|uniref:Uncharacterized protein n=1 Tax=Nocardioides baekrokdamisoli TaxID=1804624 RepID=A0A3G9J399_9ACTN|nr:hypothetical protein [Nocardioides baekrokdamisoli]BBH17479.1 hypothetical protein Back2_17660 [Nocardioides baekrokdamisoli]